MLFQQLLVGAVLEDALLPKDQDAVVVLDGGQAVGDGQGGAAVGQLFQALAHQNLALVVQGAGGLVQDEDGRVLQKDAGNAQPLLLAAGQLDAPLAHIGVVAVLQSQDELFGPGQTGRRGDLLPGGPRLAVGDVLGHRAAEQVDVLLHHADGGAQAFQRHLADVLPVDEDAARRHIVKAGDQVAQGGLAAARRAHQGQPLAGRDVDAHIAQHLVVVVRVLEADMVEPDGAGARFEGHRAGRVLDVDGGVQNLKEALDAGHAPLELLGKLDDAPDGGDQGGNVQGVRHQVAGSDPALDHEDAAAQDGDQVHQAVEQPGGSLEGRHHLVAVLFQPLEGAVARLELFVLGLFGAEGFDHPLAQQALLDLGVQLAHLHALGPLGGPQLGVQLD